MDYELTRLAPQHVDSLAALEQMCFAVPWTRQAFIDELQNPLARYTLLSYAGEAVAYAGYWHIVDEGHITNIAVHPSHRRCGLASRLLAHMLEEAQENGLHLLTLEVRVSNAAAIALYEKFDFTAAGIRKRYYSDNGEDALIMTKEW